MEQKLAQPVVTAENSRVTTGSDDLATFFERSHNDVLCTIENLLAIKPSLALGFYPDFHERALTWGGALTQEDPDKTGPVTNRAFDMTRDGFMLLVMSLDGDQSVSRVLRYIEAFDQKEGEVLREFAMSCSEECADIHTSERVDAMLNDNYGQRLENMIDETIRRLIDSKFAVPPAKSTCPPKDGKTAKQIWDATGLPRKIRGSSLWLGNRLALGGCMIQTDAAGGRHAARLFDPDLAKKQMKLGLLEMAKSYAYERKRNQFTIVR